MTPHPPPLAPVPTDAAEAPSSSTRSIRRRRGGTAVGLVAVATFSLLSGWASVASAQDPIVTTTVDPTAPPSSITEPGSTEPSTTQDPGTTALDTDAETTVVNTAAPAQEAPDTKEIDDENRKFAIVVAGLVAVAVALALLTAYYWRVTKPRPVTGDELDDEFDDGFGDGAAGESPDAVGIDDLDDDELFVSSGPRSRRAIAGADHADVDAGWEPLATGEQERVSGQVPRATSRPSPKDRARALGVAGPGDTTGTEH